MTEPLLRRLEPCDLQRLTALEREAQSRPRSSAQLGEALHDETRCVVAIEAADGELVGHAVIARLPFEAELEAILVRPAWRRRGVAVRLLKAVIEQARDWRSERLLLEVRAGNRAAIALYRGAGFIEDGRRRGYYPPPSAGAPREDAVLMSRPLAG
ncbi:ribosomal protein S18-alanine N-acetyltransferase [Halomonas campisalis]|uniref:[Ribosomal protein bS18]-alanine N-acetyltransferase n=1 Tax=Billgrantia campisalis TaxID=74661 RepID=A0ABS9P949_9GAMM|nr:ribosomal protein S18-alanine N-acetyltransferase [Halomonas campisalis]MCG6658298.1 ribosomal protein S18-alanine N-acetyltransferase [Halomonas campisalis]MDR5862968.1 ribosomal protein S18-alanine N-acetyltransferase [Halomonas campisalis]